LEDRNIVNNKLKSNAYGLIIDTALTAEKQIDNIQDYVASW